MAESTLRAYLKEIDELIEHDQLDEAIAHCRHILQTYPKHLETYRLLGKAYLEAKRYGDAADIFQRVLSAVPDDFVSHVGMSIVREDEGNTDAAIWHMERAFETNPANPAIQQELRRLFGRRDGIEPHKVRLTRGALARMYAHGELYPQAVAELRAALHEDPDRADLQVVLAEMYWRTGQRAEAAEVCDHIIEKLPFCREANRILAAAYQASGRTDQAAPFHRRLASLDPYFAFVESAMADPQTIDAGSVRLERLIWEPGQAVAGRQPVWASSLGVDLATRPEAPVAPPSVPISGPIPSWLQDLEAPEPEAGKVPQPAPTRAEVPTAPSPPSTQPEVEIPDWMREAGWQPSRGEAVEGPVSFSEEELAALEQGGLPSEAPVEGELAPGEIPEWLRAVAPKEITEAAGPPAGVVPLGEAEAPAAEEEAGLPAWLQDISAEVGGPPTDDTANVLGGWEPTPIEPEPTPEPELGEAEIPEGISAETTPFGERKSVPTWVEESAPGATDTIISWLGDRPGRERGLPREELPEWMQQPPIEEEAAPAMEEEAAPAEPLMPAWLSGVAEAAAQQEPILPEEVAWLQEAAEEEAAAPAEEWLEGLGEPAAPQREPPDWLRGIVEPGLGKAGEPSAPKEAPEWLREAVEPVASRKLATEPPEPDWLKGIAEPEALPPEKAAEGPAPAWLEALKEGVPEPSRPARGEAEWLRGLGEPQPAPVAEPAEELRAREWLESLGEPKAEPGEEQAKAPSWLEGLELETPAGEMERPAAMPEPTEEELVAGPFGRLQEAEEAPEIEPAEVPAAFAAAASPEEALLPAEAAAEDDVLQWLESLAARQEPPEAEVPAEAGIGPELAPAAEAPIVQERTLPEEPAESLEWLERLAAERGIEAPAERPVPPTAPAAPVTPAWLRGAEAPAPPAELPAEEAEEEVPAWLQELPSPEAEAPAWPPPTTRPQPPPEERAETEAPVWMEAVPEEPAAAPPPVEAEPPVWLKAPVEEAPTTGALEAPEWLRTAAEAEAVPPEVAPTVPEAEERVPPGVLETPEWLQTAAAEELEAEVPPAPTGAAPPPVAPPVVEKPPSGVLEVPEWLRAAAAGEPVSEAPWVTPPRPPTPAPEPRAEPSAFEVPEWLTEAAAAPLEAAQPPAKEPPWLTPGEEVLRSLEAKLSESLPEWLRAPAEPELAAEIPVERPEAVPPPAQVILPVEKVEPRPAPPPTPIEAPAPRAAPPVEVVAPAPAPRPQPTARGRPGAASPAELLDSARRALASGELDEALRDYGSLIRKKRDIPVIIEDLRAALARDATLAALWQMLGDAYMKADKLPEAIEAYRRGLEAV